MFRNTSILLAVLLLTACAEQPVLELEPSAEAQADIEPEEVVPDATAITEVQLPSKKYLTVPFTSQAPHANWDNPYQEACEEASVIMVDYYLRGSELSLEQADREIVQLSNWEESNGYKYDVNLADLKTIIETNYNYNARISDDVTIDSIKHEIAKGNPVILPAAGRDLGNPYFSGDGPWYHMLVVTGYNRTSFVTNDPGTRRGEGYKYRYQKLLDAVHDFTGVKEEIRTGKKRMLIMELAS